MGGSGHTRIGIVTKPPASCKSQVVIAIIDLDNWIFIVMSCLVINDKESSENVEPKLIAA
jgi:hypothetical protein